jgi:hypothetical protein
MPMISEWLKLRLQERTTHNGIVLVVSGVAFLLLKGIAVYVAYAAIIYGLYTIWKSE